MSEIRFPVTWARSKIGELFEFSYGKALSKSNRSGTGNVPVFGSNGITGYHDEFLIEGACLLVGRKGAAGKVSKAPHGCWPIDTTYYIQPPDGLDFEFCFRLFQVQRFEKFEKSTAIPSLSRDDAYEQEIAIPPLNEQKRIVAKIEELFSELDAGEESLRKARRQLGVYRQSLLKQAFEGKLTAPWRARNVDKLGKPLTASTILNIEPGPLPPGWIWQTVNDVADVSGGLTKNAKRDILPRRIPYLRVANVYANELRLDEIKDIGVTAAEAEKVRLVKGDLLIVEGNGSLDQIGRVAAWNGSISNCGHQNHLIRARCHPNAHYAFVLMFLLSPHGRDVIEKQAASTSGLHTLSVSKVQRLPVPLCSLPEQQEIVRLLDEQFTVIEQNEREIDAALKRSAALRQSILKKAFSGHLVPQDPADEPAAALLARIRAGRGTAGSRKLTKKQ